jgi:hypothetical protein
MQGLNFQLDAGPLQRIPLVAAPEKAQAMIGTLLEVIQFACKSSSSSIAPAATFLQDVSDACVMECYFREHMTERNLLFLDDLAPHLTKFDATASNVKQTEFLENLYRTLNASESPTRNRLLRLTADSPDLLAVIKNEGAT